MVGPPNNEKKNKFLAPPLTRAVEQGFGKYEWSPEFVDVEMVFKISRVKLHLMLHLINLNRALFF